MGKASTGKDQHVIIARVPAELKERVNMEAARLDGPGSTRAIVIEAIELYFRKKERAAGQKCTTVQ